MTEMLSKRTHLLILGGHMIEAMPERRVVKRGFYNCIAAATWLGMLVFIVFVVWGV